MLISSFASILASASDAKIPARCLPSSGVADVLTIAFSIVSTAFVLAAGSSMLFNCFDISAAWVVVIPAVAAP